MKNQKKVKRIKTCYIGNQDIYEWLSNDDGKGTVMPILLETCEEVINKELVEKSAVRIESIVRRTHQTFEMLVRLKEIGDTLVRIMEWALEKEEYEICARVKKLEDKLHEQNQF